MTKGLSHIKVHLWRVVASLGIAFVLIAAICASVPDELPSSSNEVRPAEIRFFKSGMNHQIRRPITGEPEHYLPDQFKVKQDGTRQFSFLRHSDELGSQIQRIFIPVSGGDISLSINGAPAARGSDLPYSGPGFGNQYLFAEINPSLFNPGVNRIDLIMRQDQAHAGIRQIYFTDSSHLSRAEAGLLSWANELKSTARLAGIISLICSLFGIIIGYHRLIFIGGIGLSCTVMLYGSDIDLFGTNQLFWTSPVLLACLSFVSISLITLGSVRTLNLPKTILFGSALVALFAAILGVILLIFPIHISSSLAVIHFANRALIPVLVFGIPLQLIFDLSAFRNNYAAAQIEIEKQKDVIAAQDVALENEIKQKAILAERQRFTRDMHDGIGGQLMSLLVRVRSGRVDLPGVEDDLKSSLTDLRMVVDSLDNVGENLGAAMATFHARASKQLEAENVSLEWLQDFDLSKYKLDIRQILNLYRLLQEVISNIVRHAEASEVQIEFTDLPLSQDLRIRVTDNGKGFDVTPNVAGKGLKNIQERARKIGGVLDINSEHGGSGTTINLVIPAERMSM